MLRVRCDNRRVKSGARAGVLLGFGPGAALGVGRFAYALVLPAMQAALQLSLAQAGLIGSANTAGYFLGALVSHRVLGAAGYRRGFYLSLILQTLTLVLLALGPGFGPILVLRFAQGVLGAMVFVGGAALLLSSGGSSTAMGFFFGGMGFGIAASTLAIPFLSSWQVGWGVLAGLSLALTLVSLLAYPALREPARSQPGSRGGGGLKRITPTLVTYGLYGAGYIGYMTFVTSNVGSGLALLWVVLGVGACLTGVVWGRSIDAFGGAVALRLVLLVLLVSSLQPLLAAAPLVSVLLFGIAFPGVITAITDLFRKGLPPHEWGRAMGLSTAAFALGQAIGPALSGFVGDVAGSAGAALWAASALLVLSLLASLVPLRSAA
ncbi:MAG: YbfB/YjiJ family MFS transporter [Trueperaceae bacterium]|nr:YbfB/YjiJ family MFS transporter [Trueperaceae bacterium]